MCCSCNNFSYGIAGAEMRAEFLYRRLIIVKIANWCYVKSLCNSKCNAFVCSLHKKVSILMSVINSINKQYSANKSRINNIHCCWEFSKPHKDSLWSNSNDGLLTSLNREGLQICSQYPSIRRYRRVTLDGINTKIIIWVKTRDFYLHKRALFVRLYRARFNPRRAFIFLWRYSTIIY